MPGLVCVQCNMKAVVEGTDIVLFDESPAEHLARVHPDPEATQRERRELEQVLEARFRRSGTFDA